MNPNAPIRIFILRSLEAHGSRPMPEDVLVAAVNLGRFEATAGEIRAHIKACEAAGWIAGVTDDLLGVVWQLTSTGRLRLQQLS